MAGRPAATRGDGSRLPTKVGETYTSFPLNGKGKQELKKTSLTAGWEERLVYSDGRWRESKDESEDIDC
jgi:hypothetical protein